MPPIATGTIVVALYAKARQHMSTPSYALGKCGHDVDVFVFFHTLSAFGLLPLSSRLLLASNLMPQQAYSENGLSSETKQREQHDRHNGTLGTKEGRSGRTKKELGCPHSQHVCYINIYSGCCSMRHGVTPFLQQATIAFWPFVLLTPRLG